MKINLYTILLPLSFSIIHGMSLERFAQEEENLLADDNDRTIAEILAMDTREDHPNKSVKRKKPASGFDEDEDDEIRNVKAKVAQLTQEEKNDLNKKLLQAAEGNDFQNVAKLLDSGADIEAENEHKNTPLMIAARFGFPVLVEFLINKGANVNVKSIDGNTPLHITTNGAIIDLLLKSGANLEAQNIDGVSPLMTSILFSDSNSDDQSKTGNIKKFKELIKRKSNVNTTDKDGNGILHCAIMTNNKIIVEECLKCINIETRGYNENTPLITACYYDNLNIIKLLLDNKANINSKNKENFSPLHIACGNGHFFTAKLLLENHADIKALTIDHRTSLHVAAHQNHNDIIELLLHYKAEIESRNKDGETPLMIASRCESFEALKLLHKNKASIDSIDKYYRAPIHLAAIEGKIEIIAYLLQYGIFIDSVGDDNWTPLFYAIHNKQFELAQFLIDKGTNIYAKNQDGNTIFHVSARDNNIDALQFLLDKKFDINLKGCNDYTAINGASERGNTDVIKFLVENRADIESRNNRGETPLFTAIKYLKLEAAKELIAAKANIHSQAANNRTIYMMASQHLAFGDIPQDFVALLLKNGAETDHYPFEPGFDTLHHIKSKIISNQHQWIKEALANNSFTLDQLNIKDRFGMTPLMWATSRGNTEIVKLLLNQKVDAVLENNEKETALILANKYKKISKLLYDYLRPQRNIIINAIDNSPARILDYSLSNLIAEYIYGGKNE